MSNFLEVDSKILENNLLLCDSALQDANLKTIINSNDFFSTENKTWKSVTPIPGCCVKTSDTKNNKIFVNICQIDDIPQPKDITDEKLLEIWQSEEITDYRIPLSIQEPHDELDKSGKLAVAYDVALNSKFFNRFQNRAILRSFVLQVIFEGIENKYNCLLKKEGYVILQNRKCYGELKPHRIRINKAQQGPQKNLIEEISATVNCKSSFQNKSSSLIKYPKKEIKFRLFENKLFKFIIGEFHLAPIISIEGITLDIGEDRLILEGKNNVVTLDLFLPVKIDETKVSAFFNKKMKFLLVIMPIFC